MASSNVVSEYWAWQKKQIVPTPLFALHDDGNIVPISTENRVKKAAPPAPKVVSNNPQEVHTNLSRSLEYFARHALRLKPKEGGGLTNFIFNRAQQYVHKCLEEQKARMGYVRAIIIKGRQQGMSAYVTARFFHRAVLGSAITVYILAHESIASQVLFKKIETYYDFLPDSLRPKEKQRNRQTFEFENLSIYSVGTAGASNTGRSQTAQFLHASELDFYANIEDFKSGVLQIVADGQGEVIMETTANGQRWAYEFINKILSGEEEEYIYIFVPWFWQDEYVANVPADFVRTEEEENLVTMYGAEGLNSNAQLQWRRNKVAKLGLRLFKQEYPCNLMEAFQASGNSYYDLDYIQAARKSKIKAESFAPRILGCDPGRTGDRTVIVFRQGREIVRYWVYGGKDKGGTVVKQTALAGILIKLIDELNIDKCFIDVAHGYGVVDICEERGYGDIVEGVHFGQEPDDPIYANKRAEMAGEFKKWLEGGIMGSVSIPDEQDMEADILAMPEPEITSSSRIQFPLKAKIKKETGRSPDILDAIMLTFAFKVRSKQLSKHIKPGKVVNKKSNAKQGQLHKISERRRNRRAA